jgi:Tfp pilus assembly protein PilF
VLKIDRDDAGTNVNLGQILIQQKKYVEAIATFRKAIEAEPTTKPRSTTWEFC